MFLPVKPFIFSVFSCFWIYFTALVPLFSHCAAWTLCVLYPFCSPSFFSNIYSQWRLEVRYFSTLLKSWLPILPKKKFYLETVEVISFLKWMVGVHVPAAKFTYAIMKKKADSRTRLSEETFSSEVPISTWNGLRLSRCHRPCGRS